MEWDKEHVEERMYRDLRHVVESVVISFAGLSAAMDGITPEDAQREIHGIVKAWLTQAKANAYAGAYKPTIKQCGG